MNHNSETPYDYKIRLTKNYRLIRVFNIVLPSLALLQ